MKSRIPDPVRLAVYMGAKFELINFNGWLRWIVLDQFGNGLSRLSFATIRRRRRTAPFHDYHCSESRPKIADLMTTEEILHALADPDTDWAKFWLSVFYHPVPERCYGEGPLDYNARISELVKREVFSRLAAKIDHQTR